MNHNIEMLLKSTASVDNPAWGHSDLTAEGQFLRSLWFLSVEAEQEVLVAVSTMKSYIQHCNTSVSPYSFHQVVGEEKIWLWCMYCFRRDA